MRSTRAMTRKATSATSCVRVVPRFCLVFIFLSFSTIQHRQVAHTEPLHRTTHTHTNTLSLARGLTWSQHPLFPLCASAPPSGSRTRIGHISDHPRTHSVDIPSTLQMAAPVRLVSFHQAPVSSPYNLQPSPSVAPLTSTHCPRWDSL